MTLNICTKISVESKLQYYHVLHDIYSTYFNRTLPHWSSGYWTLQHRGGRFDHMYYSCSEHLQLSLECNQSCLQRDLLYSEIQKLLIDTLICERIPPSSLIPFSGA